MSKQEKAKTLYSKILEVQKAVYQVDPNTDGYNYRYANLISIRSAIKQPLIDNKLIVMHPIKDMQVGTIILNTESGESIDSWLHIGDILDASKDVNKQMQAVGSAITYAKRYTLASLLGIVADEDDDGASAVKGGVKTGKQPNKSTPVAHNDFTKLNDGDVIQVKDKRYKLLKNRDGKFGKYTALVNEGSGNFIYDNKPEFNKIIGMWDKSNVDPGENIDPDTLPF